MHLDRTEQPTFISSNPLTASILQKKMAAKYMMIEFAYMFEIHWISWRIVYNFKPYGGKLNLQINM